MVAGGIIGLFVGVLLAVGYQLFMGGSTSLQTVKAPGESMPAVADGPAVS